MYGGYGYYGLGYSLFDPTMILVYIGALLSLWASSKVNSTFQRYSRVRSMTGMTGAGSGKTPFTVPGHLRCDCPACAGTAHGPL